MAGGVTGDVVAVVTVVGAGAGERVVVARRGAAFVVRLHW